MHRQIGRDHPALPSDFASEDTCTAELSQGVGLIGITGGDNWNEFNQRLCGQLPQPICRIVRLPEGEGTFAGGDTKNRL